MVLAFFRGGSSEGNFDEIVTKSIAMLGDARHSFDLATLALLTDADPAAVAQDIRDTDQRINDAELALRSELIVHVSVQGHADIGSVMGFTLLLKKIERVGDQAKSILELAEHGVNLASHPEISDLLAGRQFASELFNEAAQLLGDTDADEGSVEDFAGRASTMMSELQTKIDDCLTSEQPGHEVVPLAIYYRYLLRVVANLIGIVRTSAEPVPQVDEDSGE